MTLALTDYTTDVAGLSQHQRQIDAHGKRHQAQEDKRDEVKRDLFRALDSGSPMPVDLDYDIGAELVSDASMAKLLRLCAIARRCQMHERGLEAERAIVKHVLDTFDGVVSPYAWDQAGKRLDCGVTA